MKLWATRLLIIGLLLSSMQMLLVPGAHACTQVAAFEVTAEDLTAADFNEPTSDMVVRYQEHWGTDQTVTVLGGYVLETVYTIEPEEQWTRGAVSAVVETWGEPPADLGPFLHKTVDLAVTGVDSCGEPGDGPELGVRHVRLNTGSPENDSWPVRYDQTLPPEEAQAALTTAFGDPELVERDRQGEELMIARLGNARSGSGTMIAFAFGAILIVGGVLAYQYRKQRLLWQWDHIKAEHDAEVAAAEARRARATNARDSAAGGNAPPGGQASS